MNISVNAPEFADGAVIVNVSFWTGTKVLFKGSLVTSEEGVYSIPGTAGPVLVRLKRYFPDWFMPELDINGRRHALADPLPSHVQLWSGASLLLSTCMWILVRVPLPAKFFGGAVGLLFCAIATYGNLFLFRSNLHSAAKWIISGFYSVVAIYGSLALYALMVGISQD